MEGRHGDPSLIVDPESATSTETVLLVTPSEPMPCSLIAQEIAAMLDEVGFRCSG